MSDPKPASADKTLVECIKCGGLWAKLYVTPSGLMCRACYPDARHEMEYGRPDPNCPDCRGDEP